MKPHNETVAIENVAFTWATENYKHIHLSNKIIFGLFPNISVQTFMVFMNVEFRLKTGIRGGAEKDL